jgi:rare lipoprotein A
LNPGVLTAAHRTLPFGTKVKVTNKSNGRTVVVTINDRGPFVRGRIIDVTPAAAHALGFSGLVPVEVTRE